MNKNKIGTVFLISILALAGLGVSFGGLTDTIYVNGTFLTGTVDLVVEDYSGTWVFKIIGIPVGTDPLGVPVVYDPALEILIYQGYASNIDDYPGEAAVIAWAAAVNPPKSSAELISWSQGRPWQMGDPYKDPDTQTPYDVVVEFHNIFPCINFHADLNLHYIGTIPAKVTSTVLTFAGEQTLLPDGTTGDWLQYLAGTGDFYVHLGNSEIPQLHYCMNVPFYVNLHIPQDNLFQHLSGTLYLTLNLIQWNEACDGNIPNKVLNLPNPTSYVAWSDYRSPSLYFAYIDSILTGIPAPPPGETYNVWDARWPAWCVDEDFSWHDGYVELWDTYSTEPSMPYQDSDWPKVNWIINHIDDYPTATVMDVQEAIWYYIDHGFLPTTPIGQQIKNDAATHGDFVPQEGQLCCVLLWPVNADHTPRVCQKTFIVVDP
jgi:hypothetical protein